MASIICKIGGVEHRHGSVIEVRSCKGAFDPGVRKPALPESRGEAFLGSSVPEVVPPTEKQLSFIADLATKAGVDVPEPETKRDASNEIKRLLELPKKSAPVSTVAPSAPFSSAAMPEVPAGYYAVDEDDTLKFFRVDRPTDGKWAGYTFLKIQASADFYPIRDKARVARILGLIAVNPTEASQKYGQEIGRCGCCNRILTDETSRARGIGPDCWAKIAA